jgi:hypothetical protein
MPPTRLAVRAQNLRRLWWPQGAVSAQLPAADNCLRLDRVPPGGYVRVVADSTRWMERFSLGAGTAADCEVVTSQGLTRCGHPGRSWTIESARWTFLKAVMDAGEGGLIDAVHAEHARQMELEASGYRSFTWAVLRAAQALQGASALQGESAVSALPCFETASRGETRFWGAAGNGPTLILADALTPEEKDYVLPRVVTKRTDWVMPHAPVWRARTRVHHTHTARD